VTKRRRLAFLHGLKTPDQGLRIHNLKLQHQIGWFLVTPLPLDVVSETEDGWTMQVYFGR
jgi:hypothetical protein